MSEDAKNVVDSLGMLSFMEDILKEKIDEDNMVVSNKKEGEPFSWVKKMGGVVLTVTPDV